MQTNIYGIQAYDSAMCGYFFFEFINFMHMGNSVTDFINLFSLLNLKKMMV